MDLNTADDGSNHLEAAPKSAEAAKSACSRRKSAPAATSPAVTKKSPAKKRTAGSSVKIKAEPLRQTPSRASRKKAGYYAEGNLESLA